MSEAYKETVALLAKWFPYLFRADGEYSTPLTWDPIIERL